MVFLTCREKI